jgi:hypothetical protein
MSKIKCKVEVGILSDDFTWDSVWVTIKLNPKNKKLIDDVRVYGIISKWFEKKLRNRDYQNAVGFSIQCVQS